MVRRVHGVQLEQCTTGRLDRLDLRVQLGKRVQLDRLERLERLERPVGQDSRGGPD